MEIRELNAEERDALNLSLQMVAKFLNEPRPISFTGLQSVYDDLLSWDKKHEELEISLGVSFGQKFVETGTYEWVRVSDEYGEETVVSPIGYKTIASPISMLQKRLERDEPLELENFFDIIISSISDMIERGKYDKR